MWIYNGNAVIAVGIGIAAGLGLFFSTSNRLLALIAAILVAMVVDVQMRFYSEDCERPLIDPDAGAHIWLSPVWFVGIIRTILIGLAYLRII